MLVADWGREETLELLFNFAFASLVRTRSHYPHKPMLARTKLRNYSILCSDFVYLYMIRILFLFRKKIFEKKFCICFEYFLIYYKPNLHTYIRKGTYENKQFCKTKIFWLILNMSCIVHHHIYIYTQLQ